jgi:hypothetical protein
MPQVTPQKWESSKSANWEWTRCHILHILQTFPQVISSVSGIWKTSSKNAHATQYWNFSRQSRRWRKIAKNRFSIASLMSASYAFILSWRMMDSISKDSTEFCYSPSRLSKTPSANFLTLRQIERWLGFLGVFTVDKDPPSSRAGIHSLTRGLADHAPGRKGRETNDLSLPMIR